MDLIGKIRSTKFLLANRNFRIILSEIRRRIYSDEIIYCLRRDLSISFEPPHPKIPIQIRPLNDNDIPKLLSLQKTKCGSGDYLQRLLRLQFLKANIRTCYVGLSNDDSPCFMAWLISPKENPKLQAYLKNRPLLAADEVLLENVYIPENYRGKGIMPSAMGQLAEKGKEVGARWAIVYVFDSNIASIRGCLKAGFVKYKMGKEVWRMFRCQLTLELLERAGKVVGVSR